MSSIIHSLYEFWTWLKETFGFGNLGTIHVIDIVPPGHEEEK
jgi:hypothetical protein|nr:MAG TPA: Putative conjugal transfer nickase/helicase TraI C-term [Caudoviricetes sp.]